MDDIYNYFYQYFDEYPKELIDLLFKYYYPDDVQNFINYIKDKNSIVKKRIL